MNKQEIEKAIENLKISIKAYEDNLRSISTVNSINKDWDGKSALGQTISIDDKRYVYTVDNLEACKLAISALTQQLNDGWISVSERFPEDTDGDNLATVYVCMKFKDSLFGNSNTVYQGVVDFVTDRKIWLVEDYFNVIAWRPRFEPYKEVSE